ncbi:MAG: hypothetical protein F9K40_09120 [Kofleriaceae bacterium]|nr:MAG: hypothetical protein F9K40_09120 [Kofleriaceae bacterium]MBZ0237669.1 hypothetical protein [Kofleriaceae bacterium]
MRTGHLRFGVALSLVFAAAACGDDGIDSNEAARRAYLGLDPSIPQSLQLGFDGFNSAQSANIAPQMGAGEDSGMLTITGQVDQGASDNKGMRLYVGMVDYSKGPFTVVVNPGTDDEETVTVDLTYNTSEVQLEQPYLNLTLRNIPTGTFDGTLTGAYRVTGEIQPDEGIDADVTLSLSFTGTLVDLGNGATGRAPGTVVTGTATSGDGMYEVNLTLP